ILKRSYKVEANIGAPQVAYREKITKQVTVDYTHKKQTGGAGQFSPPQKVAQPVAPAGGLFFGKQKVRRAGAEEDNSRRREGPGIGVGIRRAGGVPGGRSQGDADRRRLSRRRFVGARLRDLRARGAARGAAKGLARPARADHEGRGGDARRLYGFRH